MTNPSSTPLYKFVQGLGDQTQIHEINVLANLGYRVVSMVYNESETGSNHQVLVLMGLASITK
jgi:hypothetical protein